MKIRLQLQKSGPGHKKKALQIAKQLLQKEGVSGLWKGNVPAEILYVMYGAVQFSAYATCSRGIHVMERNHGVRVDPQVHSLLAGMSAGVAGTAVTYPFDYLRTRLAANSDRKRLSMSKTCLEILRLEGWRGLYAGFTPTLLSVAAASSIMFWSCEVARKFVERYELSLADLLCGFFAGLVSKCLTFPLDTLRKRAQMYTAMHGLTHKTSPYRLLRDIIRKEGPMALYRGFVVSLLKTSPTSAIALYTYEYTLNTMRGVSSAQ